VRFELCRSIGLMLGSILGMCTFFLIIICKGRYLPCSPSGRSVDHRRAACDCRMVQNRQVFLLSWDDPDSGLDGREMGP
jgi:hypothetical protein